MKDFQTIRTFNFAYEIIILKSILEKEGIAYLFQNENLIAIDPLGSIAYGGIHLKVHINDFLQVQAILDNLNTNLKIVE
jgi:hypothetical protein